mmetsp:Transcript_7143/g.14656  ORF Transcript_7143/g.14656 Transcript_7143/m.14656 type:complete len:216 (+) Transcript_7143:80-727(+)
MAHAPVVVVVVALCLRLLLWFIIIIITLRSRHLHGKDAGGSRNVGASLAQVLGGRFGVALGNDRTRGVDRVVHQFHHGVASILGVGRGNDFEFQPVMTGSLCRHLGSQVVFLFLCGGVALSASLVHLRESGYVGSVVVIGLFHSSISKRWLLLLLLLCVVNGLDQSLFLLFHGFAVFIVVPKVAEVWDIRQESFIVFVVFILSQVKTDIAGLLLF